MQNKSLLILIMSFMILGCSNKKEQLKKEYNSLIEHSNELSEEHQKFEKAISEKIKTYYIRMK